MHDIAIVVKYFLAAYEYICMLVVLATLPMLMPPKNWRLLPKFLPGLSVKWLTLLYLALLVQLWHGVYANANAVKALEVF